MLYKCGKHDRVGRSKPIVATTFGFKPIPEIAAFDKGAEKREFYIEPAKSLAKLVTSLAADGSRGENYILFSVLFSIDSRSMRRHPIKSFDSFWEQPGNFRMRRDNAPRVL